MVLGVGVRVPLTANVCVRKGCRDLWNMALFIFDVSARFRKRLILRFHLLGDCHTSLESNQISHPHYCWLPQTLIHHCGYFLPPLFVWPPFSRPFALWCYCPNIATKKETLTPFCPLSFAAWQPICQDLYFQELVRVVQCRYPSCLTRNMALVRSTAAILGTPNCQYSPNIVSLSLTLLFWLLRVRACSVTRTVTEKSRKALSMKNSPSGTPIFSRRAWCLLLIASFDFNCGWC